jgi:transcriptional regulator with XRE-family HTH domain
MLPERIRDRMQVIGINQSQLARRSSLSTSYISDLLSGKRGKRLSFAAMEKLRKGLRVPTSFFSTETPHMRPTETRRSEH